VDCNEVGFSPKNVDAICRIGSSTKASAGGATRYVGEKGIGFKSVFKVADVVYVSSGHYTFKFDKQTPLGMIAPIWAEFPLARRQGYTSFLLKLCHDCNQLELTNELRTLDPRMLMFLRQLRQINILIDTENPFTQTLSRMPDIVGPKATTVRLRQNNVVMRYIVIKHAVTQLPLEPKRAGICDSEIMLAFPIHQNQEPLLASQQVYAFLPIRDYGFQVRILHPNLQETSC